ncbi:hypothetical protein VHEMI02835 [[Torrubiella] hemipterigena]|uniref:Uncharacterized protein n=1 Tax=[Torrubiella] hemipterigena TaxID=1531966 RepID=A0A0A1T934_9HYPO|nr:hypothetical protein VHEMI02835 [[Torrubiella] hemipterigena]
MNPYFTLAVLVFAIVFWVILRAYGAIGLQLHNMRMHSDQQICSRFTEIVTGTSHLNALDWREQSHRVSQIHIDQRLVISQYQDAVTRWRMVAVDVIFCVATALSVIGSIHFGLAPYYSALLAHLVFPRIQAVSCIVDRALDMDVSLSTTGQMRIFTDEPEPIEYGDNASSAEWPEKGHIEISDVAVQYECGGSI